MRENTFNRPAREYPPKLSTEAIAIDPPPTVQQVQVGVMGWLQYLLPAVGGLGSVIFILAYHPGLVMIIAGVALGVSAVMSGIIMGIVQRRGAKKQARQQTASYLEYLAHVRKHLLLVARMQRRVDTRLYPFYSELARRVEQREYLWERRPTDQDFLSLRMGVGPGPLCRPLHIDLGNNTFLAPYLPDLRARAEALIAEYSYLPDLSATVDFRAYSVLSLCGEHSRIQALARALLCQLVAFHSPEDVRCFVAFSPNYIRDWVWVKWLPHGRCLRHVKAERGQTSEQRCMMANTPESLRALLQQQLIPELEHRFRLSKGEEGTTKQALPVSASLPHIFLLLDGFSPTSLSGPIPELYMLLNAGPAMGLTILCLADDRAQEPVQVQARLAISEVGGLTFEEIAYGGQSREGLLPDEVDLSTCERIARSMAPLALASTNAKQDLSRDVRLLDLLALSTVDHFDPAEYWRRPRAQADLLRVPIGMRSDGHPLYLDMKEAADKGMGPHGLIVGATGSGKSELLRTLVVSLAITHNPQTLNFVLVDFKGGASFADFAALPHVAGIVTNLQSDPSLVDRVYASLLGEQQRRQQMLQQAGNLDNIKQYQTMWQTHQDLEPMTHLLIIVDEFAELIASRPDFLDLFVTIGRVGRSLGLHLLFATQRLEEGRIKGLESHLRYRICLRTFSASESKTVLGTSDAYYLPSVPGMGYFKVDTDTYDLFKSALISVPYVPHEAQSSLKNKIRIFTATGALQPYLPVSTLTAPLTFPNGEREASELYTEMDVLIERFEQEKHREQAKTVHQVWLPPLEKTLALGAILNHDRLIDLDDTFWKSSPPFGDLRVPVGMLDLPLLQRQEPLWLDFSGIGGHLALVGASQTGKSTFLRTLVTAFMLTHSPRDVQFYGIDMGGGLLRIFEQAPHVGAVCGKSEREKIRRVVRQMGKIIEEREFLFREQSIDSMATFRARRQQGELDDIPFGDVFLLIDNFAQFYQEFEQLEPALLEIISNGLNYGVHLIVTANRWMEIRPKLRENIGKRLEFRLSDPTESELGRGVASALRVGVPGRGATQEKLYFQTALPMIGETPMASNGLNQNIQQALSSLVWRIRLAWKGEIAPPIHMLPILLRYEDLPEPEKQQGVPLGLEEFRLSPLFIDLVSHGPHFLILGDTECGKTSLLRAWIRGLECCYHQQEIGFAIVDYRKRLLEFAESEHLLNYAYNSLTLTSLVGNIASDLEHRLKKTTNVPLSELSQMQKWEGRHYFLFIDDYETIMTTGANPLAPLMEYLFSGSDIGFHLVIARRVGGMGRAAFEPVIQRLREMGTPGLIMSGDPSEGKVFHGQSAGPQPPGRGYFVQAKHPPILIQTALAQSVASIQ